MRVNLILLALVFSMVFVLAVPPQDSQQFAEGFVIRTPLDDHIKIGQDHEIEIHVYNISNGHPLNNSLMCYLHLYGELGTHELIMQQLTVSNLFDYGFNISKGNFSEGYYWYNVNCYTANLGGYGNGELNVNNNGQEPEGDIMRLGFSIMFILIISLFMIVIINTIAKFSKVEFSLYDMAFSFSLYFGLLAYKFLTQLYIGSVQINAFLDLVILWTAFPLMILPGMALILTIVIQFKDNKLTALDWGKQNY